MLLPKCIGSSEHDSLNKGGLGVRACEDVQEKKKDRRREDTKQADRLEINDSTLKSLTSSISLQTFHQPVKPNNKHLQQKHCASFRDCSLTAWLCVCRIFHLKVLSDSFQHH